MTTISIQTIYTSLIYCSILLFILSFFMNDITKLNINIASYSILATAIILIMCFILSIISTNYSDVSIMKYIMLIYNNCGPYLLILTIISYILFIFIKYKLKIENGHVPESYYTFFNISTALTLFQVYIILNGINERGHISNLQASFVYLIGTINLICVITLYIMLNNFNTDGFEKYL